MHARTTGILFTAILSIMLMSGCAAVVVGGAAAGGTYAYTEGWLSRDYNAGLDRTYNASLAAARQTGIVVQDTKKDLSSATISGKSGDQDVWIKMDSKDKDTTKVSVRVGYLGDEEASKRIQESIQKSM